MLEPGKDKAKEEEVIRAGYAFASGSVPLDLMLTKVAGLRESDFPPTWVLSSV